MDNWLEVHNKEEALVYITAYRVSVLKSIHLKSLPCLLQATGTRLLIKKGSSIGCFVIESLIDVNSSLVIASPTKSENVISAVPLSSTGKVWKKSVFVQTTDSYFMK